MSESYKQASPEQAYRSAEKRGRVKVIMQYILRSPMAITVRLRPGVVLSDGSSISLEPIDRNKEGRVVYWHAIDAKGLEYEASDLCSGVGADCDGAEVQDSLRSLISFLLADAEGYRYRMSRPAEPADYVTNADVAEWAYQHENELSMLALDLEESEGLCTVLK